MSLESFEPDYEEEPRGMTNEEFAHLLSPEVWDKMNRLAYRKTGDYHDAQDVVQTAYVRLLRHKDRFEGRSKPATWMHRILINAAWTQHYNRKKHKETVDVDELAEKMHSEEPSPEELFEAAELRTEIDQILDNMRSSSATMLRLLEMGYTQEEIAKSFGISKNAVKIRIHRARKALSEELYN